MTMRAVAQTQTATRHVNSKTSRVTVRTSQRCTPTHPHTHTHTHTHTHLSARSLDISRQSRSFALQRHHALGKVMVHGLCQHALLLLQDARPLRAQLRGVRKGVV